MAEDVKIFVEDPANNALEGVYVGLHNSTTKALLQAEFTDANGIATFPAVDETINSGVYEIRVKPASAGVVTSGALQNITVLLGGNNNFDIEISFEDLPVATSPNLCRVSGYLLDHTGQALPNVSIAVKEHFGFQLDKVSSGTYQTRGILPSTVHVLSDSQGYFQFDLYRCAEYILLVQGYEDNGRYVKVPDAASVNLADLLFSYVHSVTFTDEDGNNLLPAEAPTLSMAVDDVVELTYKVTARSGISLLSSEVNISSPDVEGILVSASGNNTVTGNIRLTALAVGNYTLVLSREVDGSSAFLGVQTISDYPVIGALVISVT